MARWRTMWSGCWPIPAHSIGEPRVSLAGRLLIGAIRVYRAVFAPHAAGACRFHPSCSAYAVQAVSRHGAAHGAVLAVRRLARCRPFGASGFDPVP